MVRSLIHLLLTVLFSACASPQPIEIAHLSASDLFGAEQVELTWTYGSQEQRWSSHAAHADGRLELVRTVQGRLAPERFEGQLDLDETTGRARVAGQLWIDGQARELEGELVAGVLQLTGDSTKLLGQRAAADAKARTYNGLPLEIFATLEASFHDARALELTPAVRFKEELRTRFPEVTDDLELLAAFELATMNWSEGQLTLHRRTPASPTPATSEIDQRLIAPSWILLDPSSPGASPADLAPALDSLPVDTERLVIDLRDTGRSDLALLGFAAWLGLGPEELGVWSAGALYRDGATPDDSAPIPVLALEEFLQRPGAALPGRFRIDPGPRKARLEADLVFILDESTGVGATVLAAAAVHAGRASWFGALPPAAGLLYQRTELSDNFDLWLPVARHRHGDGRETGEIQIPIDPNVAEALTP